MRTWHLLFLTLLFAALHAHGCGGQKSEGENRFGSETNWLGDCRSTGRCADGECICGVCTRSCTLPDVCSGSEPATCVTQSGAVYRAVCGEAGDMGPGVCLGTCASSSDCESGMQCVGGACLPESEQAMMSSGAADVPPRGAVFLGQCMPAGFAAQRCTVVEAFQAHSCDCSAAKRRNASATATLTALETLATEGACGGPGGLGCENLCVCEVLVETGEAARACQNDLAATGDGWCPVEPLAGIGDPALTADCPPERPALARILDPLEDSRVVVICQGKGQLGDPCLPGDEERPSFSDYDETEISVEERSPDCESGICLVNHFQGRVSCPYGQAGPEAGCLTPSGEPVAVSVEPQLIARRAEDTVHCSCRCDGPEDTEPLCQCPSGMVCTPLIDDLGLGSKHLAGSYCVKEGTVIAPERIPEDECDAATLSCGPAEGPGL